MASLWIAAAASFGQPGEHQMVNENDFFRNATLKLCGRLEIDEALQGLVQLLKEVMPVWRISLQTYEDDYNAMRSIAYADGAERGKRDTLTPMPPEARERVVNAPANMEAFLVTDPRSAPVSKAMFEFYNLSPRPLIVMPLWEREAARLLGMAIFLAEEGATLDEGHRSLVALLRDPLMISLSNALIHLEVVKLNERLADDNRQLQQDLLRISGDEIVGADFGLRHIMQQVQQVAPTDSPVLLTGETGVGKDVIANAIHLGSPRRDGPFIPVNCGAIPESLLDSELFGHEKGAFTGALSRKRGRFERADKGTILLDEIGEMPLEAQVRLLRVLQHREIERIGGTGRIPVDIRIIAATNKDLVAMVKEGRFRQDLFFRLNVFPIAIPALRDRTCDIPALVQHFVARKAKALKVGGAPQLAVGAMDTLMAYAWPGNVRELENVIERAMILHGSGALRFDDLGASLTDGPPPGTMNDHEEQLLDLDTFIARHIRRVLEMTDGKIHGPGGAGELLNVNPNTVRYKMRKLGIAFQKQKRGN
jgi:transcriptional regulator with GAF, ATPase, and Fis domain